MTIYDYGFLGSCAFYFLCLCATFLNFELKNDLVSIWGRRFLWAGFIAQSAWFSFRCMHGHSPRLATLSGELYITSFLIVLATLFMEWRFKTWFLTLFSMPLSLALLFTGILLSDRAQSVSPELREKWIIVHATLILTGFAALVISAASAAMYLLQAKQLKSKHLGRIFSKLPSLSKLDRMHFLTLFFGVVFFTAGILGGFLRAGQLKGLSNLLADPKVLLSIWTCFLYWVVLGVRLSTLRKEQKIAMSTVALCIFLVLTLVSELGSRGGFHKGI